MRTHLWSCRRLWDDDFDWLQTKEIQKHAPKHLCSGWSACLTVVSLKISVQVGERQHVLVTEESFDAQYYVAHNKFYEQVRTLLSLMSIDLLYIEWILKKIVFEPHSHHHWLWQKKLLICNWWVSEPCTQPTHGLFIFTLSKWDQRLCFACLRSRLCRWQKLKCVA